MDNELSQLQDSTNKTQENDLSEHSSHNHLGDASFSRLFIVLLMTSVFMFVEAFVGYRINSLALIADAGHMLNDVLSILLAIVAIYIASKPQSSSFTFGYKRVEVLSGMINGLSLIGIAIYIIYEAISRFQTVTELVIQGNLMLATASLGLIVNAIGMKLLESSSKNNMNIEGAYQHIVADLLGSVAAIIAGLGIILWKLYWLDLVVSFIISLLIIKTGSSLLLRATRIILQATPKNRNLDVFLQEIYSIRGVIDVHDFHGWSLTSNHDLITGHITIDRSVGHEADQSQVLDQLMILAKKYNFHHPTFQIEFLPCTDTENCYPKQKC